MGRKLAFILLSAFILWAPAKDRYKNQQTKLTY